MKSFVEQSERHYVSVPRHHLWSRIYIILRVLVFLIYVACMYLYAFPCVCTCVAVYMCVSPCTTILSLSLSLPYLLSYFLTFVLSHASFRSFLSFSRSFSPAHFALLSPHVHAHTFSPPAFLSLSVLLSDIPRALFSLDVPILVFLWNPTRLGGRKLRETERKS